MRALIWSPHFTRTLRRTIRQNPQLHQLVGITLHQLADDPFHPALHSHKLKAVWQEHGHALKDALDCAQDRFRRRR